MQARHHLPAPHMPNPQRFVSATQWLRPYTRWAARFAYASPAWVPAVVRHAPLRLSSLILRTYHRFMR